MSDMNNQNGAPERIARIIRENLSGATSVDPGIRAAQEADLARTAQLIVADLARADRAAPEEQARVSKIRPRRTCKNCGRQTRADQVSCTFCGVWDEAAALTPPPAAPTDDTALAEVLREADSALSEMGLFENARPRASIRKAIAALASREAPPAAQKPVTETEVCPRCKGKKTVEVLVDVFDLTIPEDRECPACTAPPAAPTDSTALADGLNEAAVVRAGKAEPCAAAASEGAADLFDQILSCFPPDRVLAVGDSVGTLVAEIRRIVAEHGALTSAGGRPMRGRP